MNDVDCRAHALASSKVIFASMKQLADKALAQVDDRALHWTPDPECNSIAVIVQHLHGNMRSRWTEFLTTDGEKPWRERDGEFIEKQALDRSELLALWEKGWSCVFGALDGLAETDLMAQVKIRGQAHTVLEAIHRQVSHYAYHIGQIVYLAKLSKGAAWQSLSIARGQSRQYRP